MRDTVSTSPGARAKSSNTTTRQNSRESQTSSGVADKVSRRPSRPTSQERQVRSLVLDTRYNRLLLVKSMMMSEAEGIPKDITRTNSLPSSRRRSRFKWVFWSTSLMFVLALGVGSELKKSTHLVSWPIESDPASIVVFFVFVCVLVQSSHLRRILFF